MLFVDTWGWLALRDKKDAGFRAASLVLWENIEQGNKLCTTDYVLDETITRVYQKYGGAEGERILEELLESLESCKVQVERITVERFDHALRLRRRYRDKPDISFTDFTSMVVMRELAITDILTGDQHFTQVNLGFRLMPGSIPRTEVGQ